jgi:integrase/recombinase XerD
VHRLVGRLRRRTGIVFEPHWLRHTYATDLHTRRVAPDASFDSFGDAVVAVL